MDGGPCDASRERTVTRTPKPAEPGSTDARGTDHRWIQAELRLLRHGETAGYEGDLGLSDRGREQAREAAAALAAEAHGAVRVLHAPSVRARLTAEVLAEQLGTTPQPDPGFANFAVAAGEEVREQAEVFGEYAGERRSLDELPGWLADLARFRSIHVSGGDPIGFWLTTPLLGFEPPAVVVRRYWRAIVAAAGDDLAVVAVKPSPPTPMRALVAHAFGRDLGEPDNLEAVAIQVENGRARVAFRGESVELAVPDLAEPSWWR
jgi:broad specificity phosphatase PhoE